MASARWQSPSLPPSALAVDRHSGIDRPCNVLPGGGGRISAGMLDRTEHAKRGKFSKDEVSAGENDDGAAGGTCVPPLIADQEERVQVVMAWAGQRVSTRLALKPSAACHGVGAFADSDIQAGDLIMRMDRTLVVTHQTCLKSLPALESVARMPEFSSFILWLVQQRLLGERSAWCGYVQTLPAPVDIRSALFLDEDSLSRIPIGGVREACNRVRARVRCALDFIAEMARDSPQVAKLFHQNPRLFDRGLGLWASAVLLSRAFTVRGRTILLPCIDLVNSQRHAASCELQFDAMGSPILRATSAVPKSQEVFIEYGAGKSDAYLIAHYGYCHGCHAQEDV